MDFSNNKLGIVARLSLVILALALSLLIGIFFYIANPFDDKLPITTPLIAQHQPLNQDYFSNALYTADYLPLLENSQTQIYRSFCGVASAVMVLQALGLETQQEGFFSADISTVRSWLRTFFTGMPLSDFARILETQNVNTRIYYGSDISASELRNLLKTNLNTKNDFVIANYSRPTLGQSPGGHISPVAAYREEDDSVLVLDVASYKYPPVWVPLDLLYKSLITIDSETGLSRGIVTVSKAAEQ